MTSEIMYPSALAVEMRNWIADYICSVLQFERDSFDYDARFDTLGLDSVEAVILSGMMEERFGIVIDPSDLFSHPTATSFAVHVAGLEENSGDRSDTSRVAEAAAEGPAT